MRRLAGQQRLEPGLLGGDARATHHHGLGGVLLNVGLGGRRAARGHGRQHGDPRPLRNRLRGHRGRRLDLPARSSRTRRALREARHRTIERREHLARGREALLDDLVDGAGDHVGHRRGGDDLRQVDGITGDVHHVDVDQRATLHHALSTDHLGEEQSYGVDVRAGHHPRPPHLLGRHVVRRPDHLTGLGELSGRRLLAGHGLGDPEIEHLRFLGSLEEEDVAWLDVAMDDAHGVRRREGAQNVAADLGGAIERHRAVGLDELRQGRASEQLEGDVADALLGRSKVEQLHDVRVAQLLNERRLALEALRVDLAAREVLEQNFERDLGAGVLLRGAVHRAKATAADDAVDPVASPDHVAGTETRCLACCHARPHLRTGAARRRRRPDGGTW